MALETGLLLSDLRVERGRRAATLEIDAIRNHCGRRELPLHGQPSTGLLIVLLPRLSTGLWRATAWAAESAPPLHAGEGRERAPS
jgi:hypothetical protein